MKVLKNLFGLNKKISASEIAVKKNNKGVTLNDYLDNLNEYSTEETVIGKWIDGKPLYRKVTELEPVFEVGDNNYSTGIEDAEVIVNSTLHFKYSSKWYTAWDNLYNKTYNNNGSTYVVNSTGDLSLQAMYLITEYTKTTD